MKKSMLVVGLLLAAAIIIGAQQSEFPKLTGPYLGQKPPGTTPEIFAPGIISTKADESAFEINKAGDEMVFIRKSVIMLVLKSDDDKWSMPAVAPFSGKHIDDEPFFSPDGCKIYFMSRRPAQGSKFNSSLWVVEKRGGKWGGPKLVKLPILSKSLHAPTISANNSVYDDGISIIQFKEGRYHDRESITGLSGMYPFVAPDESYIIYSSGYLGSTGADLFISCKNKNGLWSKGISLGSEINSSKHEGNSFLTTDGKYLFFSRGFDIYWVSAKFIEKLKQQ